MTPAYANRINRIFDQIMREVPDAPSSFYYEETARRANTTEEEILNAFALLATDGFLKIGTSD